MITHDRLKNVLDYDPVTGQLVWLEQYHATKIGGVAGSLRWHPKMEVYYLQIKVDGVVYLAHRLAFFWMTGSWPEEIDHADGNPMNNRWSNLREASRSQNRHNSKLPKNNKTGLKGVAPAKSGNYRAVIWINRKSVHLGTFITPEAAHAAYCVAAKKHFGEFARFA